MAEEIKMESAGKSKDDEVNSEKEHNDNGAGGYPDSRAASPGLPFPLIPGETVSHLGSTRDGSLIALTNYRLHIAPSTTSSTSNTSEGEAVANFINIPLPCIETTEARDLFFIHLYCKDARYYRVSFGDNSTCEEWQRRLGTALSQLTDIESCFALKHFSSAVSANFEELEEDDEINGSKKVESECDRFQSEVTRLEFNVSCTWRISKANKDFTLCPTYPPEILVPACITDESLEKVAAFRSARRVPAVVWRHPKTGAVLARCSQPEVGWLGWREKEDEELVRAICDASAFDSPSLNNPDSHPNATPSSTSTSPDKNNDDLPESKQDQQNQQPLSKEGEENGEDKAESVVSSNSTAADEIPSLKDLSAEVAAANASKAKVLIVDARSYTAAFGNRVARGGGVECIEYYPTAEIIFMSLGNIHNIRKSFQALRTLCNQTPAETYGGGSGWLAALDATKWLYHAAGLLKAAARVATALHEEGRPGEFQ